MYNNNPFLRKSVVALTFATFLLQATHYHASADNNGSAIDRILSLVETNNKQLQANTQQTSAQKLTNRSENNLPDPTVSYAHVWDSDDKDIAQGELIISQSFDFPSLYATRGKLNRHRNAALDAEAAALRQDILLQAQELCIDIITLSRQQELLDQRHDNAQKLSDYYEERLETGDANVLARNKARIELLNVRTEARTNRIALNNKLRELTDLNGGKPLTQSENDEWWEAIGLNEFPEARLPLDFEQTCQELIAADPNLQALRSNSEAARRQISVSRQGWLPGLEVGYRRNADSGHPLNGIVVGFSVPIFQNHGKVKAAKAEALNADYQHQNSLLQATSALWQLYHEARELREAISEYHQVLAEQRDLDNLKRALEGGEINTIDFFVEVSDFYQSKANLLDLESQYHKAVARLYKNWL